MGNIQGSERGRAAQIAMGLRVYFDKALPQQLLYASELEQADEVRPLSRYS